MEWVIEFAGQSRYLTVFNRYTYTHADYREYCFGDRDEAIRYGSFGEACTALRQLVRMFPELLNTAHVSPKE